MIFDIVRSDDVDVSATHIHIMTTNDTIQYVSKEPFPSGLFSPTVEMKDHVQICINVSMNAITLVRNVCLNPLMD